MRDHFQILKDNQEVNYKIMILLGDLEPTKPVLQIVQLVVSNNNNLNLVLEDLDKQEDSK